VKRGEEAVSDEVPKVGGGKEGDVGNRVRFEPARRPWQRRVDHPEGAVPRGQFSTESAARPHVDACGDRLRSAKLARARKVQPSSGVREAHVAEETAALALVSSDPTRRRVHATQVEVRGVAYRVPAAEAEVTGEVGHGLEAGQ
jgi:hypothetical protein